MVGGGGSGKAGGIVHIITIMTGFIITMFPVFILMSIRTGEDITGIMIGTDTIGTMIGHLTTTLNRTGSTGIMIGIGKDTDGALRTIILDRKKRCVK
jgi:hypothetical protein